MSTTPIVALDTSDLRDALAIVDELAERCDFYKVGAELFTSVGPSAVEELRRRGKRVFLDLKYHDIPHTVGAAALAAARLGVSLLTVHASGGEEMLRAAVSAAGGKCAVLAVTVLTSLDAALLGRAWGRAGLDAGDEVLRLARLAEASGAHGVVCAGSELATVRALLGDRLATLVPGIRFGDAAPQDQKRVATPFDAARLGASYIVVGRAVTGAPSAVDAIERVRDDIRRAAASTEAVVPWASGA
jgi:orotidine-5'-phosphate decarboxylase